MRQDPRIALFGGSFDPIHLGHLGIASRAREALELDEVRFLPCRQSPHKEGPPAAPDAERVRMIELALEPYSWARPDFRELEAPPPSYSADSVRAIRAELPDARLFWILGLDQWQALPRWREPDFLARELEFIVFSRHGDPRPRDGWTMTPVSGTHPASSSEIRRRIAAGRDVSDWLPAAVAEHIHRTGLYRNPGAADPSAIGPRR